MSSDYDFFWDAFPRRLGIGVGPIPCFANLLNKNIGLSGGLLEGHQNLRSIFDMTVFQLCALAQVSKVLFL